MEFISNWNLTTLTQIIYNHKIKLGSEVGANELWMNPTSFKSSLAMLCLTGIGRLIELVTWLFGATNQIPLDQTLNYWN
jgi:hypothetical protein